MRPANTPLTSSPTRPPMRKRPNLRVPLRPLGGGGRFDDEGEAPPQQGSRLQQLEQQVRDLLLEADQLRATIADRDREIASLLKEIEAYKERTRRPLSMRAFEEDPRLAAVFPYLAFFHTPEEARLFFDVLAAFCPMNRLTYYEGVKSIDAPRERNVRSPSEKKGGRPPAAPRRSTSSSSP